MTSDNTSFCVEYFLIRDLHKLRKDGKQQIGSMADCSNIFVSEIFVILISILIAFSKIDQSSPLSTSNKEWSVARLFLLCGAESRLDASLIKGLLTDRTGRMISLFGGLRQTA